MTIENNSNDFIAVNPVQQTTNVQMVARQQRPMAARPVAITMSRPPLPIRAVSLKNRIKQGVSNLGQRLIQRSM